MQINLCAGLMLCGMLGWNSSGAHWTGWRGPLGIGQSSETNLPVHWDRATNVKWRVPLPEPGNSTPVVWNNRIFLAQAEGDRRTLMCLDRAEGKLLWQSGINTSEREPTHPTNPYCPASPATDGERVIVSFASDGLYCYGFDGKELWRRTDLGRQIHIWGNGSSPVIHEGLCFLNFGPGETTYLIALDKATGQTVWKTDEPSEYVHPSEGETASRGKTYIGSWTTPTLMPVEGRLQLLMSWPNRLAAYDPATGKELWTCSGLNPLVYTSPIYSEGIVISMGGFNGSAIAVRAGGQGDVTESRRVWQHPRTKQRIGSGVVHDGHVYIHNDPGIAECFDLKTGDMVWEERLKGPGPNSVNWSSVLLAENRCYTINQSGDCFVFEASPRFKLLSINSLGERSNSSIVPSKGGLLIRTHKALWCFEHKNTN